MSIHSHFLIFPSNPHEKHPRLHELLPPLLLERHRRLRFAAHVLLALHGLLGAGDPIQPTITMFPVNVGSVGLFKCTANHCTFANLGKPQDPPLPWSKESDVFASSLPCTLGFGAGMSGPLRNTKP